MIIAPKTRGFICLTAHPTGCAQNVKKQIAYIQSKGEIKGAKKVLVIGSSTGFGLASRITSAFGSDAATIGVFFDKPASEGRPASPGFYNTAAFEKEAHAAGLYAKSINGDAFSNEVKEQVIDLIKEDLGHIDLVIYSLASPVRTHPVSGKRFKSVLKPIGETFSNKTVDFHTGKVAEVTIKPAEGEDVENTVTVMGGEDWKMWMDALKAANVLAEGVTTVAYSYIGPSLTEAVYRKGTIGAAKDDLEATAFTITNTLKEIGGKAYVSVNKALVTQASSAIPVIPLYISLLFKVMKEKGIHEGCIEQIQRLYSERLYGGALTLDDKGRIRIDDWEMREDVQQEIAELWKQATTENLPEIADLKGYSDDFFNLFGFEVAGVDYNAEVNEMVAVPSIQ
ncbi:enoyl-ACP reductase FabV [Tenacibaculum maritimum]|uniref:enoyl-ACP reductase FabV n=1 Tax=Tenacibaculum maritimum TaxID=107401 RepID=UPI0010A4E31E|nr:enoyl-ACP reductase FabV [Tenacibaculum maritimum]MCD9563850.1 trans-2-enoyl-CoA reductase family protein [Tenacibaculum maritimum]MCD9566896.1 trans-2-enoyl-CoA reductase family protein [Tenacibaculum maritimum]MCD9580169.1 trans-2-enoyl-CoA reductase family protein [Tenacibaculum maritimum]MCD9597757.1 trans-2-enoyl-CoA reductase family protein [Tenacibaculum maritimum]MCD9614842.1 trans-2-enoyl-CoA reductase family protein [Tenacibaculum maritimum]